MKQEKQFYKEISSGQIYFIGNDQKNKQNLINANTGSEYFLPGFFDADILGEYFELLPASPSPVKEDKENSREGFTGGEWFVNWSGHPDNGRIQIGSGKDWVCEMYHFPDDAANEQENDLQTKANARLIAAAPSMYAALKEVSPLLDGLINRTPTGKERNDLCDLNIKVKSLLTSIENKD